MDILRLTRLKTILLGGNLVQMVRGNYRQHGYDEKDEKDVRIFNDLTHIQQLQDHTMLCEDENGNTINVPITMSKKHRHAMWNFFKRIDSALLPNAISWYPTFTGLLVEKEFSFYSRNHSYRQWHGLNEIRYSLWRDTKEPNYASTLACADRAYNHNPHHLDISHVDFSTLAQFPQLTFIVTTVNHLTGHLPMDIDVVWPKIASIALEMTDISGSLPPRLGNLKCVSFSTSNLSDPHTYVALTLTFFFSLFQTFAPLRDQRWMFRRVHTKRARGLTCAQITCHKEST